METLSGGCHCRNITVEFETTRSPEDTEPRACQCSFCRQHQSRAISDPAGRLDIRVQNSDLLSRYQFGLRSIEFLVCRNCGVYVAGFLPDPTDEAAFATLMVSALDDRHRYLPPQPKNYDGQSLEDHTARRRKVWTPATLKLDQTAQR